jgi:hypothetical protein
VSSLTPCSDALCKVFGCGLCVIFPTAGANLLLTHLRTRLTFMLGDKGGKVFVPLRFNLSNICVLPINYEPRLPRHADDFFFGHA